MCHECFGSLAHIVDAASATVVDSPVAAVAPAQLLQSLQQRSDDGFALRIACSHTVQYADAKRALDLLPPRRKRPYRRNASEKRYELAPPHRSPEVQREHGIGLDQQTERGSLWRRSGCAMSALGHKRT